MEPSDSSGNGVGRRHLPALARRTGLVGCLLWAAALAACTGETPGPVDGAPALATEPAPGRQIANRFDARVPASVATWLERLEAFGFSGAALVGLGEEVVHASGHGLADREAGRPFTTGTVFSLGSITKLYTAAAVLRLVGRGELSLADTLGTFIPDLPADRAAITVEQLLTHTSGLGEIPYPDEADVSRRLLVEETRKVPLVDEPGASVSYSNLGFSLLGVILEEATGQPYEEALRQEVLRPARAWETGYTLAAWGPERLAVGYERGERWGTIVEKFPHPSGPSWALTANGGLHATLFDAFRFVRAFVEGEILAPELVAASFEPHRGRFQAQGLGWHLYTAPDGTEDGTPAVGHDGSNKFLTASVRHLPERDVTVVLAANQAGFTALDAMPALLLLVTGLEAPMPPEIEPHPLFEVERWALAGDWQLPEGRLRVVDGGDHLQLHLEGQGLLDRVLGADAGLRARLAADTERARRIVESARLGDAGVAGTLVRVWQRYEERFGEIEEVEVLGSAPVWYHSPRASWLRFHFLGSERTPIRRLHWSEDGRLSGIGGSVYPAPLSLRCVGSGSGECTALHLNLAVASLRMKLGEGGGAELQVGGEVLLARRTADGEE